MKWILGLVAVIMLIAGAVYWQSTLEQSPSTTSSSISELVPADTLYFVQAQQTQESLEFMSEFLINGSAGSHALWVQNSIDELSNKNSKMAKFFLHLLKSYQAEQDGTVGGLLKFLGMYQTGESALYSHGLMPVIKLPLADAQRFTTLIDEAANNSGLVYENRAIAGEQVRLWPVESTKEPTSADSKEYIALLIKDDQVTLTFLHHSDPEALQKERLGLAVPAQSLAKSNEAVDLANTYNFNDFYKGFIHWQRFANTLAHPSESQAGRELLDWLNSEQGDETHELLSPECANDLLLVAQAAPRLVFGYQNLTFEQASVQADFKFVWEIANQGVKGHFNSIQGHLSQHAQDPKNKLFSVGLGVDFDKLTPALTSLWKDFTQAQFTCPSLVDMQKSVKSTHPMMLGMVLGMVQGVKGAAFSLYDAELTEGPVPNSLSALLTIASNDPMSLASLTAMSPLPELAQLQIPADGSAVTVPLSLLPPNIELKAAVRGNHLALFTGEKAANAAQELADEQLSTNGLFTSTVNYDQIQKKLNETDLSPYLQALAQSGDCTAQLDFVNSLYHLRGHNVFITKFAEEGAEIDINATMKQPDDLKHDIDGKYSVDAMNTLCQWQPQGNVEFTVNGAGTYSEPDFSEQCFLVSETFKWNQTGAKLELNTEEVKSRELCGNEYSVNNTSKAQTCYMSQINESGFICYYLSEQGAPTAVRYRRTQ